MSDDEGCTGERRDSSPTEQQHGRRGQAEASATLAGSAAPTPEEILRLLESCQLTDEQADELLKDAYSLNRLLRAHLAHVEAANGGAAESRGSHRRGNSGETSGGSAVAPRSGKSRQSSGGGGGGGFGRQLGGGAVRHEQSSSRRSVSLSGRTHVTAAASSSSQQRLPPIARAKSPGQRLSQMARAYSSGVIQPGHRGGTAGAPDSSKSAKKRL